MSDSEFQVSENLSVTEHHDVYAGIDPRAVYATQAYKNKVVLISGASRGIGQEIALTYARAGAALSLLARSRKALSTVKDAIKKEVPHARIENFEADVADPVEVKAAVEGTVGKLGGIDIVVANAGKADRFDRPFTEQDPSDWWRTFEVNVRGVFNLAHSTIPHLKKTKGYIVAISSAAAQARWPFFSAYGTSKHTLGRFVEFIAVEHPEVKAFALHPGAIVTDLALETGVSRDMFVDTLQLPAATLLRLTSGKMDWLSSKYVSSNWDLDEVETDWKEKIINENVLINKLSLPTIA